MPSDITGTDLVQEDATTGRRQMVFAPGPIFANIVLADEINRTPPKTQSALLEAMQEHRVTVQGKTYQLAEPFYVFATQNPIELEGTYPLPEAQLDRFMYHIIIEHPPYDEELGSSGRRRRCRTRSSSGRSRATTSSRSSNWAQGAGRRAGDAARARHRARHAAEKLGLEGLREEVGGVRASVRAAQHSCSAARRAR